MTVLREVLARFGIEADTSGLQGLTSGIDQVVGRLRNLGTALSAGLRVNQIRDFALEMSHASEEVRQNAARLGMSVSAMQELGFAAGAAGQDMDVMVDAMSSLQERARDAALDPASDPAQQFRLLGVEARDASGELKSAEVLISEVADGLRGMKNQTDRVGAAMTLFGDVGRELLPILQDGAEGLDQLRQRARELGGGFSDAAIAAGAELSTAIGDLDMVVLSLKSRLATVLLPIITRSTEKVIEFAVGFLELTENSHIVEAALGVLGAAALAFGVDFLIGFAGPIAIAGLFAIAIAFIVLLVDDLITLFSGGTSVIGAFVDGIFGLGTAAQFVADMKLAWEGLTLAVQDASDAVRRFLGQDVPERATGVSTMAGTEEGFQRRARADALRGSVLGRPGESREDATARANRFRQEAIQSGEIEADEADIQAGLDVPRMLMRPGGQNVRVPAPLLGAGGGGATVDARATTTIQVAPGTDRRQLEAIRRAAGQVMDERNRAAAAALAEEALPEGS
ncbi:MAG: hypothetical protein KAT70_09060 [Thermoplasmata archaeon]|nr:hypothetical protein [Thermoplasmata archaeon]